MPAYLFVLSNGSDSPLQENLLELESLEKAKYEAAKTLAEVIRDEVSVAGDSQYEISVFSREKVLLFSAHLQLTFREAGK